MNSAFDWLEALLPSAFELARELNRSSTDEEKAKAIYEHALRLREVARIQRLEWDERTLRDLGLKDPPG